MYADSIQHRMHVLTHETGKQYNAFQTVFKDDPHNIHKADIVIFYNSDDDNIPLVCYFAAEFN